MKDALSQVGAPEKGLERKRNIKGQIQRNKWGFRLRKLDKELKSEIFLYKGFSLSSSDT